MRRVEITIENVRRYTEVALFVDQPGFIDEVEEIRKKLDIKIKKFSPGPYNIIELDRLVKTYDSDGLTISELSLGVEDYCHENNLVFAKIDRRLSMVRQFAEILAHKYGKNRLYIQVAIAAIFDNLVSDHDYKPTQLLHLNHKRALQLADEFDSSYFQEGEVLVIQIDPETTQKELLKSFRLASKHYLVNDIARKKDTMQNVKDNRNWYWMRVSGMGYEQICKATKDQHASSWDGVRKGIKQYEKALEV